MAILSFHPWIKTDVNRMCAGRDPNEDDLAEIMRAHAVILPQGCRKGLYEMARRHCRHVFPNYDARFAYPGKIGQIRLFRKIQAPHPRTALYPSVSAYQLRHGVSDGIPPFEFPFVAKLDWGGEGDTVRILPTADELAAFLEHAALCEKSGRKGFLLQEYVPSGQKSLRVVRILSDTYFYWRVQETPDTFLVNLSGGGRIVPSINSEKESAAIRTVDELTRKTGINLAAFDFLFNGEIQSGGPLFLEINYFFGRRGFGGSEKYLKLLSGRVKKWIQEIRPSELD